MRQACVIGAAFSFVVLGALSGCHAPTPPSGPTVAETQAADLEDLWTDALRALRDLGFEPDRQDRVHRIITTHPMTSAQWYEFWRRDVADAYSLLESSLHAVQRRVTVQFTPLAEGRWTADVRVDVARLDLPERQATTASAALHLFSSRSPTLEGEFRAPQPRGETARPLGRDPAMEHRIVRRILQSSGGAVASAAPSSVANP